LVLFQSEEVLLNEDSDIYFLGEFASISSAHLFLTGFPILSQSQYREQSEHEKEKAVAKLLEEISGSSQGLAIHLDGDLSVYKGNLLELLSTHILPKIMCAIEGNDSENLRTDLSAFRHFMHTYPHQQDIEKMISILENIYEKKHPSSNDSKSLALLCKKMSALHHEEFEILPAIQKELEALA
jgi:hypothetical protein